MADEKLVRVRIEGESWWAEHVEGDIYMSRNNTVSGLLLDLPPGYDMEPMRNALPRYPGPEDNGKYFRAFVGHLLRCERVGDRLTVVAIVGWKGETEGAAEKK